MAPNCVINWDDQSCTINPYLGKCMGCKGSGLYLVEKNTCSFASTLEIVCGECNTAQEKSRLEIRYIKKKIDNTMPTNNEERGNLRTLKLQRDHKVRKMH